MGVKFIRKCVKNEARKSISHFERSYISMRFEVI